MLHEIFDAIVNILTWQSEILFIRITPLQVYQYFILTIVLKASSAQNRELEYEPFPQQTTPYDNSD